MRNIDNIIDLPYGKIIPDLLEVIVKLLEICNRKWAAEAYDELVSCDREFLEITNKLIINKNSLLYDWYKGKLRGKDKHLVEGMLKSHQEDKRYPRIINIIIKAFIEAKNHEKDSKRNNNSTILLPSPFLILSRYLTSPDQPQTYIYSYTSCLAYIFHYLDQPVNFPTKNDRLQFEESIYDATNSLKNYERIQMRWPELHQKYFKNPFIHELPPKSKLKFTIAHIFAMRGISNMWFRTKKDLESFFTHDISFSKKIAKPNFHFRPSQAYRELPSISEILNDIFGIHIPIAGIDVVFNGGLKKAQNSGIIMSVSGDAGTGKTSFALAIAAALSPLKTRCFYISLEEGEAELKSRLKSIIPTYYDNLSFYKRFSIEESGYKKEKNDINEWFFPVRLKGNPDINEFSNVLRQIRKRHGDSYQLKKINRNNALIVIDNINNLVTDGGSRKVQNEMFEFINECRKLDAFVIIISGEKIPEATKMEYLVDISIDLEVRGLLSLVEKPFRVLILRKSRQQISRGGTHLFHLSGDKGFRIAPQIPSQLDRKSPLRKYFPKDNLIINTLNLEKEELQPFNIENVYFRKNLNIFPNSLILIHGVGSCGKAGFALKILLTPPIEKNLTEKYFKKSVKWKQVIKNKKYNHQKYQNKILVISFLYEEDYYNELIFSNKQVLGLYSSIKRYYPDLIKPIVNYLSFYPGFLSAEDIVNKITRKLDEGILNGEPYTGLLLDGMHNVFLQFKKLQERDMIWPMLYNIFSHYNLTVITTFTNFKIEEDILEYGNAGPDLSLMQKGQTPFLHALVKATDFYLSLNEEPWEEEKIDGQKYIVVRNVIRPKIAIKQEFRYFELGWDKHRKIIYMLPDYKIDGN